MKVSVWFRKGLSVQHCFLAILEKWKSADCLSHDLLLAKLNGYGFSLLALRHWNKTIYQTENKEL